MVHNTRLFALFNTKELNIKYKKSSAKRENLTLPQ